MKAASRGLVLGLIGVLGCAGSRPIVPVTPLAPVPQVRVGVVLDADEITVGAPEAFTVGGSAGILAVGRPGDAIRVRREGDRLVLLDPRGSVLAHEPGPLWVRTDRGRAGLEVDGIPYPGRIELRRSPGGGLHAVNEVDMETYLQGVVPREIGHKEARYLEAAKAQAVAARTYAVAHLGQYAADGFDLQSGVRDQVYTGLQGRHPAGDRAVIETAGIILSYEGEPIRANYASTCGGKTAGVTESFGSGPIPYLVSHEDRVGGRISCRTSKYYRWETSWTHADLLRILARTVPEVLERPWAGSRIRDIRVEERGKSGRAVRLVIRTDRTSYMLEKGDIRWVLRTADADVPLWSTSFRLEADRSGGIVRRVTARGGGWGHGVGMCQWGAMQLSTEGHGFQEILDHYYPGARLVIWYGDGTPGGVPASTVSLPE